MSIQNDYLAKVCIFGDGGVGKTSLVKRYLLGTFDTSTSLTIGVDFYVKKLMIENIKVTLQLWDMGGEEHFRFILGKYISGSSGGIFMFDITRYSSLKDIRDWLEIFREEYDAKRAPGQTLPILMVGGKMDLDEKRSVQKSEALGVLKSQNLYKYMECSSKTGENVEKVFETLSKELLRRAGML
ncbi:MAG: Small GTP-binding domain protein [Promethearchaeota archaeon]|nr:MAG: Small GTP-binding domain protein [Candidatus Lokiarchaeota archaeon]